MIHIIIWFLLNKMLSCFVRIFVSFSKNFTKTNLWERLCAPWPKDCPFIKGLPPPNEALEVNPESMPPKPKSLLPKNMLKMWCGSTFECWKLAPEKPAPPPPPPAFPFNPSSPNWSRKMFYTFVTKIFWGFRFSVKRK